MTCRDIIIKELERLGADGLMHNKESYVCQCTPEDWSFLCGYDGCVNCIPAKLINGQWVPVEDKEYCEYTYKDYEYSSGKCRADTSCGIFWYGEIDLLHNFKHCPECSKEIREVK